MVSEDEVIAARRATSRQVTKSPFGDDDEIGMLNLITNESIGRVLGLADFGTYYDLSVEYFVGMPAWVRTGDPSFQIWMSHRPAGTVVEDSMDVGRVHNELVGYSGDCITMYSHCGTHMDALNHFGYRGAIWNGFTESQHMSSRSWMVCGPEKQPPVITRGVLVDVPSALGMDMLPDSFGIGKNELVAALDRQATEIHPGDVVLVRTGRMRLWPDQSFVMNEPGLNRDGAEFLARKGAIAIGADNQALEQMPAADEDNWQVVHTYLLAEAGVPIIEVLNLEDLARDKLYEFILVGLGMRIRGATAAPMRPIAFPFRER